MNTECGNFVKIFERNICETPDNPSGGAKRDQRNSRLILSLHALPLPVHPGKLCRATTRLRRTGTSGHLNIVHSSNNTLRERQQQNNR
jgi:hypothetical protein